MKITDIKDVCSYYVFSVGNELYGTEAQKVKEIKSGFLKSIYPPIDSISALVKRIYSGAESLPILDLSALLISQKSFNHPRTNTIIIIETGKERYNKKYGLLVDTCMDIIEIKRHDKLTTSLFGPYIKQYFICEEFSEHKEVVKVLDTEALWEKCCPPLEG